MTFQPEADVELTSLLSIKALARRLVASNLPRLDAVICNAGMGGWTGLNWPLAVWKILLDIRTNTTWPTYKLGIVGAITKPQLPAESSLEPPLGEIFCANLFGHYMLVHWLMPLLRACPPEHPAKTIWVSSIEPQSYHFNPDDFQGLRTDAAYEHSKRMTDLLALTSTQPSTTDSVSEYCSLPPSSSDPPRPSRSQPTMHLFHPGIVVTSVITLYWLLAQGYLLGILFARLLGAPWSTVHPYTAAAAATFLALSPETALTHHQEKDTGSPHGTVKWGTAVDVRGRPSVRVTEVDKWGLNGSGVKFGDTWWGGKSGLGRKPGMVDATEREVAGFIEQGRHVWRQMEALRVEWERRIEEYERQL